MSNEKWMPVLGYEDTYEVSSLGNVRRKAGSDHCPVARPRKLVPRGKYFQVVLSQNGKVSLNWVHRLVAQAFLGPPTNGAYQVNHKDGNGQNNRVANLEWTSHSGNAKHAYATGLKVRPALRGSENPFSKLSEHKVREIRAAYLSKTAKAIAADYGVSIHTIRAIVFRHSWRHVA